MTTRLWQIDPLRSHAMGMRLRIPSLGGPDLPSPLGPEQRLWAEIVFVAICHATNWDRLHAHIIGVAVHDPHALTVGALRDLDAARFREVFGDGFEAEPGDVARRVRILRDLGAVGARWQEGGWLSRVTNEPVMIGGPEGLYARLAEASCFAEDPLAKKPRVLAHQLARLELIDCGDPENLAPAVDYHLIRLYLRTGRVRAGNRQLADRLRSGTGVRMPQLTRLRMAVEEAMWYTAAGADLRMDWLNHIEWQLARSFCTRDHPRCNQTPIISKPLDAVALQVVRSKSGCPLAGRCAGQHEIELTTLVEPQLSASFY